MAKNKRPVSESSTIRTALKAKPDTRDTRLLVNKLTVGDARRLLLHEGGERSIIATVVDLGFILVTAALVAHAIAKWNATMWHLLLPLLAQYVALNTFIPILQSTYRLPNFQSTVYKCLVNIAGWFVIAAVIVVWHANSNGTTLTQQLQADFETAWGWIFNHQMHWPIATAFVGFAVTLPAQFRACRDHGPPFVSVSFGCAIRILILFFFFYLSWMFLLAAPGSTEFTNNYGAWIIWGLLLLADLLAWYGLLVIRLRLERLEKTDKGIQPQ